MTTDLSRRMLLAAPALLSACSDPSVNAATVDPAARSKLLVAYFTRSGNTKVIAGTVQRALGADLFEIRPAKAYPEDYLETVEQARKERDSAYEPALAALVPGLAAYDTLFLAFPIWGETVPPVIRSFLRAHGLSGKVLRPLITHGGYGLGNSMAVLQSHAIGARIEPPFVMEADQERRTLTTITSWLDQAGLKPEHTS